MAMPLVQQLVFEQCTKECKRAITPWKGKGLEAWLKACREIGGPLTNAGLAAAVLAAMCGAQKGSNQGCFSCGQMGHFKRQCPQLVAQRGNTQNRAPGTCPRCKKGKHWANECRSTKDINGMPISSMESKNGTRGPRPQGPEIYGAIQDTNQSQAQTPKIPIRNPSEEQRQALPGWTSVPPPGWY